MLAKFLATLILTTTPLLSWEVSGELLYWRASTGDIRFLTVETPVGFDAALVEPGRNIGFSIGGAYTAPCFSIGPRWTHFNSTDSLVIDLNGRNSFLPFEPVTAQPASAKGSVKVCYDVVDLEGRTGLACHDRLAASLFLGLRYSKLRLDQIGQLIYFEMATGERVRRGFTQPSRFWGLGPRVGLSGSYQLCYGLELLGELGGSLLSGEYQSSISDRTNQMAMFTTCFFTPTRWAVVPQLEVKGGIAGGWGICGYLVKGELGYRMDYLVNVLPLNYGNLTSVGRSLYSVGFSGLYGRLGVDF